MSNDELNAAMERLAEALRKFTVFHTREQVADDLTAQGFGHQEDILRAFAEWLGEEGYRVARQAGWLATGPYHSRDLADRYLASLAARS